jgi:hypothetical protein
VFEANSLFAFEILNFALERVKKIENLGSGSKNFRLRPKWYSAAN